jgi:cell division protein FtsL
MRKFSEQEIRFKMNELRKEDRKLSRTENTFFGLMFITIICLIISGIGKIFSK